MGLVFMSSFLDVKEIWSSKWIKISHVDIAITIVFSWIGNVYVFKIIYYKWLFSDKIALLKISDMSVHFPSIYLKLLNYFNP